eukprot:4550929-Heterocapsa_arctica.AAC.1
MVSAGLSPAPTGTYQVGGASGSMDISALHREAAEHFKKHGWDLTGQKCDELVDVPFSLGRTRNDVSEVYSPPRIAAQAFT